MSSSTPLPNPVRLIAPISGEPPGTLRGADGMLHYRSLCPSLTELLDDVHHHYANRIAIEELGGQSITYGDLWTQASRIAGGLQARGTFIGDRIVLAMPPGVRWARAYWATILVGAIPVSVSADTLADEVAVARVAHHCGAVMIVRDDEELPRATAFIDDGADLSELALLMYADGAQPHGVELSHENVLSAIQTTVSGWHWGTEELRHLVIADSCDCAWTGASLFPTLACGGTIVVGTADPWSEQAAAARASMVTTRSASVTLDRLPGDIRVLNWHNAPAAPSPERPGLRVISSWGIPETAGSCALVSGRAAQCTEVGLTGPDAADGWGELVLRGPAVSSRYWLEPEYTADKHVDNWFRTGKSCAVEGDVIAWA